MEEFTYKVHEKLAILSNNGKGYTKEVRMIEYNNSGEPVIDIRTWKTDADGTEHMNKGVTIRLNEVQALIEALSR